MSETCIVDFNSKSSQTKMYLDSTINEYSMTTSLGSLQDIKFDSTVLVLKFQFGELRLFDPRTQLISKLQSFFQP